MPEMTTKTPAKNVLWIMCDQLRYDYLGCTGHPVLKTPNIDAMAKRGVLFMVCATASRALATRVAGADGNVDAVLKEFEAHFIPNARFVSAGVVGVIHAQERGYSYLHVG